MRFLFLGVMPQKLGDTILIPAKSPSLTFNKVQVWRCHRRRRKMMTRFLDPHSHLLPSQQGRDFGRQLLNHVGEVAALWQGENQARKSSKRPIA